MVLKMKRRKFISKGIDLIFIPAFAGLLSSCRNLLKEDNAIDLDVDIPSSLFFDISLAEWSLHKSIWSGSVDHLDFACIAKETFGIKAIEYVNQFFIDKAEDMTYLAEMKKRAKDNDVRNLIIMIDMEGSLGILDEKKRIQAIENHYKWIEAAQFLECQSIRVNAAGKGHRQAVANAVTDSLGRLCDYANNMNVNILVENHGGYSSDVDWVIGVMNQVNHPNCGLLPDLGNFMINLFPIQYGDPYEGIRKMMPYAKGVSAKSHDFNKSFIEKRIDYNKMLRIIHNSGFRGYIGIEYEGYKLSETAGIKATKKLLVDSGSKIV
jgi:sugar phosphate isomerase/epimerase